MTKFVAQPETEILGQAILAVTQSINYDDFGGLFEAGLKQYNFPTVIDPEQWYPLQMLLDIYKSFYDEANASPNLVSIGMKVIEASPFPPEVDSVVTAVAALNSIYEYYVRNYEAGTEYQIETLSATEVRVTDHTPFPHDLVYGYMYAIARRFAPEGEHITVIRTFINDDEPDAAGAVYTFTTQEA